MEIKSFAGRIWLAQLEKKNTRNTNTYIWLISMNLMKLTFLIKVFVLKNAQHKQVTPSNVSQLLMFKIVQLLLTQLNYMKLFQFVYQLMILFLILKK